jgi:hypothetical protein
MSHDKIYPCETILKDKGNLSIFFTAVKHDVATRNIKKFKKWQLSIREIGWTPHPYFASPSLTRKFEPHSILTPAAFDALLGGNPEEASSIYEEIIDLTGNPKSQKTQAKLNINFILTLDGEQNYINSELQLFYSNEDDEKKDKDEGNIIYFFKIKWVDLWFFNDSVGILAFKTELIGVNNEYVNATPTLNDLNNFNRILRQPTHGNDGDHGWKVRRGNEPPLQFWPQLVYDQWLGGVSETPLNALAKTQQPSSSWEMKPYGSRRLPTDLWDRNNRYSKVLTAARIPNLTSKEDEFLWNAPLMDPPVDFKRHSALLEKGEWNEIMASYQRATLSGYPSIGDLALYELASTGDEGSAGGLNGKRGWQMSPPYLANLFKEQGIEIWEYSRGLVLHDTCAFLAYDESMPTLFNTERWYYPLYVYFYHLQFRMNCFAEEMVDPELTGLLESRRLKNQFMAFRNQFWFCNVSADFQGEIISDCIKKAMRLDSLYETVQSEINEISEFIDEKIERGKNAFIAALVIAFYPISYLWEISGLADLLQDYAKNHYLMTLSCTLGFILVLILGTVLLLPKIAGWGQRFLSRISKLLS